MLFCLAWTWLPIATLMLSSSCIGRTRFWNAGFSELSPVCKPLRSSVMQGFGFHSVCWKKDCRSNSWAIICDPKSMHFNTDQRAGIPFYLEWLLGIWPILEFSWILLRKIQEELPNKFNKYFLRTPHSCALTVITFSVWMWVITSLCCILWYLLQEELPKMNSFSTYESINIALPKQIYLLVWELEG